MEGTRFDDALKQCEDCGAPCCSLYGARLAHVRGACTLEELLLPTFVAQRWAPLLETSSPPIAMRAWGNLFAMERRVASREANETLLDQLALHVLADMRAHPHVFALKVPRFTFSQSYRLLGRLRGACIPGQRCSAQDLHDYLSGGEVWKRLHLHLGFAGIAGATAAHPPRTEAPVLQPESADQIPSHRRQSLWSPGLRSIGLAHAHGQAAALHNRFATAG